MTFNALIIRKLDLHAEPNAAELLWKIKFETIHNVNRHDYSLKQVLAWAPTENTPKNWPERIRLMDPFIAEVSGKLVGFADLQNDGYIDHFFCHLNHQGQGIGTALMQTLIQAAEINDVDRMYSHVSITARPFFEHFGFSVVKAQEVEIRGEVLTSYVMEKKL